jgi:hypothetical protein
VHVRQGAIDRTTTPTFPTIAAAVSSTLLPPSFPTFDAGSDIDTDRPEKSIIDDGVVRPRSGYC